MSVQEQLKYDQFDVPIPGQSLTQSKEDKLPYEKPSKFVDVDNAAFAVMQSVYEPEFSSELLKWIREGADLATITQIILFKGFMDGLWNPDLMLLLIRPVMLILHSLADQANVQPIIYRDDEIDLDSEETTQRIQALDHFDEAMRKAATQFVEEK